jgi:hypothetical protein
MSESELLELGQRLERVERSVRRYRAALGIAGLLFAGCLLVTAGFFATGHALTSTSAPAQIVARSFVLVDANGRTRAKLWVDDLLGETCFWLYDQTGTARVILGTTAPALQLLDKAGKLLVALGGDFGTPFITLFDKAERPLVDLSTVGGPALQLYDKAGKPRAALTTEGDATGLVLRDKAGKLGVALEDGDGVPRLVLYDTAEKARAALGAGNHGALLALYDKAEKIRAALGTTELKNTATGSTETRAESSLVLFNQRGRVLWEAP